MSNARNLARLIVDSDGDVDVSSLGNVPPSNDASALTTGTLPVGRLPSGLGGLVSMQGFTTSGTWTKPAGVTKIKVIVTGGGGSGGGTAATYNSGGSGGAGGTAIKIIDVSAVSSVSVTVGAGGAGATGAGNGSNGGTSSFGAYCSATGGTAGGYWNQSDVNYGAGGTATGGDINIVGGRGTAPAPASDSDENPGSEGGPSYWGGGGTAAVNYSGRAATSGQAFGSGGGGRTDAVSSAAGNGAGGIVYVEEFA